MADDTLKDIVNHLEFLGYSSERQDDGWTSVSHPTRPDFFMKPFAHGVRAVAFFRYDEQVCGPEWLSFANNCNEASRLASFSVFSQDGKGTGVRSVVVFPLAYDKVMFGAWMEAWQQDLEILRNAPERERASAVTH
jgi:hypothetical protein